MDQVYYSAAFFSKPRSSKEHEHLMQYVKLRRPEPPANHGDYLGQELQEVRADPGVQKVALELRLPKTWLTIADRAG